MSTHGRAAALLGAAALLACGGDAGNTGGSRTARVPSSAGTVWEVAHAHERSVAPAAIRAFAYGVDVAVLDGNELFAGTRKIDASGGRLALANGVTATVESPNDSTRQLRFSTGEQLPLQKRRGAK